MFENLQLFNFKLEDYLDKIFISDALCFKRLILMNIRRFFSLNEILEFLDKDINFNRDILITEMPKVTHDKNLIEGLKDAIVDFSNFDFSNFVHDNYVLRIVNCENLIIKNLNIKNTYSSGILVYGCSNLAIENSEFKNINGVSIVIGGKSKSILIEDNIIENSKGAGILIGEEASKIVVENNIIINGMGKSNWEAGIVVFARNIGDFLKGPQTIFSSDLYWPQCQRIFDRIKTVKEVIIRNNTIKNNMSSGIYIDGAIDLLVCGNLIEGNSKEGICLDQGTTRAMLLFNTIKNNGQRWGKSDYYLMKDFVLKDGRMRDGTANAKVPGISVDNSILNLIAFNYIINNFGSGVKLVRSSFLNEICHNLLINNNLGENEVHHFYGIEIGSAPPDYIESEVTELDFLPSSYNFIHDNTVLGVHWSGIYVGYNCIENVIEGNIIKKFKYFDVENYSH